MNFNPVLKRMFSVLLVFLLVFSSFSLPITFGAQPALAKANYTKLIYSQPDLESFYKNFIQALGARKDIVIYTDCNNYSELPDDLQEIIVQTKGGDFALNATAKFRQRWELGGTGALIGVLLGGITGFLLGDPNPGVAAGVVIDSAIAGALLGTSGGLTYSKLKEDEHYGYIVNLKGGNIYLNAVSK